MQELVLLKVFCLQSGISVKYFAQVLTFCNNRFVCFYLNSLAGNFNFHFLLAVMKFCFGNCVYSGFH